jgi:hypothetical protein
MGGYVETRGTPKLVSLLKALHNRVIIKFFVDGVEQTMESIIGVKQGDILGPDIFFLHGSSLENLAFFFFSYAQSDVNQISNFLDVDRQRMGI